MKKLVILLVSAAALFVGPGAFAQDQITECNKFRSFYTDYRKQNNYERAIPNWRKAYEICDHSSSEGLLLDGINFMRRLANEEKNEVKKMKIVDTLLTITDERLKYFPKSKVTTLNTKGTDVHNFFKNDNPAFQHKVFSEIISELGDKAAPNVYLYDYYTIIDLYQAGEVEAELVINKYSEYMETLDGIMAQSKAGLDKARADLDDAADPKRKKSLEKSIKDFEKAIEQIPVNKANIEEGFVGSKVASCDQIIKIFTPKYEADPDNVNLVNTIVFLMNKAESCNSNDLYLKAATAKYRLAPSANSAYALYRLNAARGNNDEAVKFLQEAAENAETDADKADYYYELGGFYNRENNKGRAVEYVRKAAELNPDYKGRSLFLIGTVWGGMRCGEGAVGARAHFWVAVDYLNQAKAADPSLTADANRLIGIYSGSFPKAEDAFFEDVSAGQSYTVSCGGMTATTTVRTR